MNNPENYENGLAAHELFLSLKSQYKRGKLTENDREKIRIFLEYAYNLHHLIYVAFALRLVSDERFKFGTDEIFRVYNSILKDKKLHPLLPRLIFPNWLHFKQHRPEAIDLLFMYLCPQRIRINRIVHENTLRHYSSNFRNLNSLYQNRIFEYCLLNQCSNSSLLKVFAKQHTYIHQALRACFMEQILNDPMVQTPYLNAFIPTLKVFKKSQREQITRRISGE